MHEFPLRSGLIVFAPPIVPPFPSQVVETHPWETTVTLLGTLRPPVNSANRPPHRRVVERRRHRGLAGSPRHYLLQRLPHCGEPFQTGACATFAVGERNTIAGLSRGVEGMRVGGRRRLRVGPHLTYRKPGVPGLIPPNAKLVFEVELLAVG